MKKQNKGELMPWAREKIILMMFNQLVSINPITFHEGFKHFTKAIKSITDGRTESLRELTFEESEVLIYNLEKELSECYVNNLLCELNMTVIET